MINDEITKLEKEIESREIEIDDKLAKIEEKQKLLDTKKEFLDEISGQLYMKSRYSGEQLIFSFSTLDKMLQNLFVKKNAISILREDIEKINGEYSNLLEVKVALEEEKEDLDAQKKDLDDSYKLLAAEKSKIQAELNAQIATKNMVSRRINGLKTELSSMQYNLLLARQGGTHVNPGSVPTGGDPKATLKGFLEQAPSGTFGVFSIGAYAHRNGMSQWGAKARAEGAGGNPKQDYLAILKAYYPKAILNMSFVEPEEIYVKGWGDSCTCQKRNANGTCASYSKYYDGSVKFSTYMNGIYEMPSSWNPEALKAQAVASRSYAISIFKAKGYIQPNQSNQVYKDCDNASGWKNAVAATRGQVLMSGSKVLMAEYDAVHGGWINGVGWDTTDKSGSGDWMGRAWDSLSKVSWFYKAWYRLGPYDTGSTCSRNPWVTQAEMADILNAYQVWKSKNWKDDRIYPVKDACHPDVGQYTFAELRKLAARPVTRVYSVVVYSSNGSTTYVKFSTDAGVVEMTGSEFKLTFNTRAPGHLRIQQENFAHFNIHMVNETN
jgi:hypothetical protein